MYSYQNVNSFQPILNSLSIDTNDLISPKTAVYDGPPPMPPDRADQIAVFEERIFPLDKEKRKVPIYNSRAAFFFKTKMAIDAEETCYSLCNTCKPCCSSFSHHFYVMPSYTQWARLGDMGVVVNLNTEEQQAAYAIFADYGPDKTRITNNGTLYEGRLGEGSACLGQYLKIKDSEKDKGQYGFEIDNMFYIVLPGTSIYKSDKQYTLKEINEKAHEKFQQWGGWKLAQKFVKEKYGIELKP